MARFRVNAEAVNVLSKEGKAVWLKRNQELDSADYDGNMLLQLSTNGRDAVVRGKLVKDHIAPSIEWLEEAPKTEGEVESKKSKKSKKSENKE